MHVYMYFAQFQTVTPLLRCLGNIFSGEDEYTIQACENPRLLNTLLTFLSSTIRHIVKECLWVLSNMAGNQKLIKKNLNFQLN